MTRVEHLDTPAMREGGHERVFRAWEPRSAYEAVIAIHDTRRGPAVGGTRIRAYPSLDAAIEDALKLSEGMTYKNALAGLPFGGGKAVILGPVPAEAGARTELFRAHGRAIAELGGAFITGEDVGTTPLDMEIIATQTAHVGGRESGMGDPSRFTARGVVRAMEAAAQDRWGAPELGGRSVAIQGLGSVGAHLARLLSERGARLVVSDIDPERVDIARSDGAMEVVAPDRILEVRADIFSPCALGGIVDARAIERLDAAVVCGAANNQLGGPGVDDRLRAAGVRYVPDYVANAGGVISGAVDLAGWDTTRMDEAIDRIFTTVLEVFERSDRDELGCQRAADLMAREVLSRSSGPVR
jgi:leucine dehydrogenase